MMIQKGGERIGDSEEKSTGQEKGGQEASGQKESSSEEKNRNQKTVTVLAAWA
ncbi:MAG: hypothetical protein AB7P17_10330 [Nitrospirales bacterium]